MILTRSWYPPTSAARAHIQLYWWRTGHIVSILVVFHTQMYLVDAVGRCVEHPRLTQSTVVRNPPL